MTERVIGCTFCPSASTVSPANCTTAAPLFLHRMPRQRANDLTLAKLNHLDLDAKSGSSFARFENPSLSLSPLICLFQVLLGEVSAGLSTTQVVVKELKASASVQDQMQFLEEVQPYR